MVNDTDPTGAGGVKDMGATPSSRPQPAKLDVEAERRFGSKWYASDADLPRGGSGRGGLPPEELPDAADAEGKVLADNGGFEVDVSRSEVLVEVLTQGGHEWVKTDRLIGADLKRSERSVGVSGALPKKDDISATPRSALHKNAQLKDSPSGPQMAPKRTDEKDISGNFDTVKRGFAEGWAANLAAPEARLNVEIWEEDVFVAAGVASRPREDLRVAKIGDGTYGFSIALPSQLADGKTHRLHASIAESGTPLPGVIDFLAPKASKFGGFERIESLSIRGWVKSSKDALCTIELLCDGEVFGTNEFYALSTDEIYSVGALLPSSLADGRVHWFQLRDRDSGEAFATAVAVAPNISTPESALQSFAKSFRGVLSHNAADRYTALDGQFDYGLKNFKPTISYTLETRIDQIRVAHKQILRGIGRQNGNPEKLIFQHHDTPAVSVVIPVHNKFWVTYNCMAALLLAPNINSFEVIVVDDGSSDETLSLAKHVEGITVLRNASSKGFVRSSNRGAEQARGKYVVMLNNDTEPCAGWIDELIYVFEHYQDVGLVGAKFLYPDGKLQEAGGIVFPNFDVWNYGRNGNPHEPRFNYTRQIDYVSGACIMLGQALWNELGGFDELFAPAYYEDNDLAFRVRAKGYKTYFTPFSKIIHYEGVSSGTSTSTGVKRYQEVNKPKFNARWAKDIRSLPLTIDPDLAKDRGVQLRALVIDAQTPRPDLDAGSYAAVQEMRLLQALGVKLTFVAANLAYMGGYTEELQRSGIECLYAPFQNSIAEVIEKRGREFAFVYITRYSVAKQYINIIRREAPQAKVIFNNADLHFLREIRAALAAKDSNALRDAQATRDDELSVMRQTDVTFSYTETEAAVILSHNLDASKVARCPWVVEVRASVPNFVQRNGLAFLGNYRHPPNEEALRYFIEAVMPELRRAAPGVVLKVFGAEMPSELAKLEAEDVRLLGYVETVDEVYDACRIFVAPLLSGAGIKGKVVGALAAGVPTIMTSLASEGIGFAHGSEAIVANTPAEWVAAITSLHDDEKRWTEMSRRAREFARINFSFGLGVERMKLGLAAGGIFV